MFVDLTLFYYIALTSGGAATILYLVSRRQEPLVHCPSPTSKESMDLNKALADVKAADQKQIAQLEEQVSDLKIIARLEPEPKPKEEQPKMNESSIKSEPKRNRTEEKEDKEWKKEQATKADKSKKTSKAVEPELEPEPEPQRNREEEKEDDYWLQEQKGK